MGPGALVLSAAVIRRWQGSAVVVVAAVVLALATVVAGRRGLAVLLTVLMLGFAWLVSPLLGPRSPDSPDSSDWVTAQQLARTRGVPLILWKPGCAYCIRLRLALGARGSRAVWVDIWADGGAAAATREVNGGYETTPTVIIADGSLTNPRPGVVRALLEAS